MGSWFWDLGQLAFSSVSNTAKLQQQQIQQGSSQLLSAASKKLMIMPLSKLVIKLLRFKGKIMVGVLDISVFYNEHEALLFFQNLNFQHDNTRLTMEKEANRILTFVAVCINNTDLSCLITSVYWKKNFNWTIQFFQLHLIFFRNLALFVH